jgi:hypothetical protein
MSQMCGCGWIENEARPYCGAEVGNASIPIAVAYM